MHVGGQHGGAVLGKAARHGPGIGAGVQWWRWLAGGIEVWQRLRWRLLWRWEGIVQGRIQAAPKGEPELLLSRTQALGQGCQAPFPLADIALQIQIHSVDHQQ